MLEPILTPGKVARFCHHAYNYLVKCAAKQPVESAGRPLTFKWQPILSRFVISSEHILKTLLLRPRCYRTLLKEQIEFLRNGCIGSLMLTRIPTLPTHSELLAFCRAYLSDIHATLRYGIALGVCATNLRPTMTHNDGSCRCARCAGGRCPVLNRFQSSFQTRPVVP